MIAVPPALGYAPTLATPDVRDAQVDAADVRVHVVQTVVPVPVPALDAAAVVQLRAVLLVGAVAAAAPEAAALHVRAAAPDVMEAAQAVLAALGVQAPAKTPVLAVIAPAVLPVMVAVLAALAVLAVAGAVHHARGHVQMGVFPAALAVEDARMAANLLVRGHVGQAAPAVLAVAGAVHRVRVIVLGDVPPDAVGVDLAALVAAVDVPAAVAEAVLTPAAGIAVAAGEAVRAVPITVVLRAGVIVQVAVRQDVLDVRLPVLPPVLQAVQAVQVGVHTDAPLVPGIATHPAQMPAVQAVQQQ